MRCRLYSPRGYGRDRKENDIAAVLIVAGATLVIVAVVFVLLFNRLVRLRNKVDTAWHQIDVQLNRRHDLVPALSEVVKGYAAHEKEVLESTAGALGRAQQAQSVGDRGPAEDGLSGALGKLLVVAERYPDLKADREFAKFSDELVHTETSIAGARKYYNGSVMQYDNARQAFPGNVVARLSAARFPDREYFELKDEALRAVPDAPQNIGV